MKKTLLATAIAGALGASAAAQAATVYNQDGTQLDIYGNIQLAYYNVNDDNGDSVDEFTDNGSTVGFTGQHVINPGMTGYFKAEFEHNADEEKTNGGLNRGDQAYMGLQGNFGDVRLGSWDPLIDDWIQDPITNNEAFDVSDSNSQFTQFGASDREGDKVQYLSPSFGGLQFAIGSQFKGDGDDNTEFGEVTFADDASGALVREDSTYSVDREDDASFFGGVKYTTGAFSIAAAYDNLAIYDGTVTDAADPALVGTSYDAGEQYGITGEYTMDALSVALKLERYEGGDDTDVNFYGLGARYAYGFGDIYGAYQYVDVGAGTFLSELDETIQDEQDRDETYNEVVIGATYNITSSFYTFAEAQYLDRDNDAGDGVAVGAVYAF